MSKLAKSGRVVEGGIVRIAIASALALVCLGMVARVEAQRQERARLVLSPDRQAALDTRIAVATGIADRLLPEAKQRGLADGWRRATLESLFALPPAALTEVDRLATSVDALRRAVNAAGDTPADFRDVDGDLVYTPIPPCRLIDTRNRLSGEKVTSLRVSMHLPLGLGGSPACNIHTLLGKSGYIVGLAINVTVVDTSTAGAPGFVAVLPSEFSPIVSFANWYEAGPSVQVANQGVVTLGHVESVDFAIRTSGPVHIIGDIFGAFIQPEATPLDVQLVSDSTTISAGQSLSLLSGTCPSGYSAVAGSCSSGTVGMELRNSALFINSWLCTYRNASGATANFTSQAICARIPGR